MKKVYVKPAAKIYEVETQGMIATSVEFAGRDEYAEKGLEVESGKRKSWGSLW